MSCLLFSISPENFSFNAYTWKQKGFQITHFQADEKSNCNMRCPRITFNVKKTIRALREDLTVVFSSSAETAFCKSLKFVGGIMVCMPTYFRELNASISERNCANLERIMSSTLSFFPMRTDSKNIDLFYGLLCNVHIYILLN